MTAQQSPDFFDSLTEAADYAHVGRQAIFLAIKNKRLVAEKVDGHWRIQKKDLDAYRLSKYNGNNRKINGQQVFDLDKGYYSVQQAKTILSQELKTPYPFQHIYYLLRTGALKGLRKGRAWIIEREDLRELIALELDKKEQKFII